MSKLSDLFKNTTIGYKGYNSFNPLSIGGFSLVPKTQTLPNEGGTIPAVTTTETPVVPTSTANTKQKNPTQIFKKTTPSESTPTEQPTKLDYSKYINPKTGVPYTPQEYAEMMASRANAGSIPNYAGNAITSPDQSAADLTNRARMLNNERNDIATGATDPYKVASKSGIQYTPAELSAIEKAYAGIYDPAINDVFTKLDTKQKADAAALKAEQDKAMEIFRTDEAIRQWRATTGTKSNSSDNFTDTQINKGASNAGMDLESFKKLDTDIKNFYVNPPKGIDPNTNKSVPIYTIFQQAMDDVKNGKATPEEITQEITDSNLPEAVKHYFIEQMPLAPEVKQSWLSKVWGSIFGQ